MLQSDASTYGTSYLIYPRKPEIVWWTYIFCEPVSNCQDKVFWGICQMLLAKCVATDISGCDGQNWMKLGGYNEDTTRMMHIEYYNDRSKNAEFTVVWTWWKH